MSDPARLGRRARRVVSRRRARPEDLAVAVAGEMVMLRLFDSAGVVSAERARALAGELLAAADTADGR